MKPIRIQRRRTKGWKMPPNTISVTRPGRYGNPYRLQHDKKSDTYNVVYVAKGIVLLIAWALDKESATNLAIEKFKEVVDRDAVRAELKDKNIACWCKVGDPCHGDFLLELAATPSHKPAQ